MGLHFIGGERLQRGRGIGGLLKIASKLFFPVAKIAQKVLKSNTGKKIAHAVKDQAINSSINIVKDLVEGKNIKESLTDEFDNVKLNSKRKAIEIGSGFINEQISKQNNPPKRAKKNKNKKNKNKNKSFKRDIFD